MRRKEDWTREELQRDYIETMTAVTLPVQVEIDGTTRIFNFTQAEAILKKAQLISLANCDCREKVQACDNPLDVCISLDKEAEIMISKGRGRLVSLKEAMEALRLSHAAGLVHISYTDKGEREPNIICSCCTCCCHSLAGLMRFNLPEAVVQSDYITQQDEEVCIHCGVCVNRCHFLARNMKNGNLNYDPAKCFGCGVCISTCPVEAISMVTRSELKSQKD
ncbi:MAG: ATP-binding protein [Promethearchaeota archaeon]